MPAVPVQIRGVLALAQDVHIDKVIRDFAEGKEHRRVRVLPRCVRVLNAYDLPGTQPFFHRFPAEPERVPFRLRGQDHAAAAQFRDKAAGKGARSVVASFRAEFLQHARHESGLCRKPAGNTFRRGRAVGIGIGHDVRQRAHLQLDQLVLSCLSQLCADIQQRKPHQDKAQDDQYQRQNSFITDGFFVFLHICLRWKH